MDIVEKINQNYSNFTKGLKQVGDSYMLDPFIFATHPAKKIGEQLGVSESMIIRFCVEIGYKGFKDFQKDVQLNLLNVSIENGEIQNIDESSDILKSMQQDINHLQMNMKSIDENMLKTFVDEIIKAKKRLVVGYYHSSVFAHWLYINLRHYIHETILYRAEDDVELVESLPEGSVVIIFSFFRYSKSSINIARDAKERNLKVISITDSPFSPIVDYSDLTIPLKFTKNKGTLHKGPITISFINALLFEVLKRSEVGTGLSQNSRKFYVNQIDNK